VAQLSQQKPPSRLLKITLSEETRGFLLPVLSQASAASFSQATCVPLGFVAKEIHIQ